MWKTRVADQTVWRGAKKLEIYAKSIILLRKYFEISMSSTSKICYVIILSFNVNALPYLCSGVLQNIA